LFDVTHMGAIEVRGRGATRFIDTVSANYAAWLEVGQSQYSYLLTPDAKVIDDIMVYRRDKELFLIVVNAANHDKVVAYFKDVVQNKVVLDSELRDIQIDGMVEITDLKDPSAGDKRLVDMALQGPKSMEILQSMAIDRSQAESIGTMKRNEIIETVLMGIPAIVSTTGYTGEETAFELYVHPDNAPNLWRMLLDAGEPFGLAPCGLGARDSLRIEAGLPLYGHELAGPYDIDPGMAGYSSFVRLHKPFFVGRKAFMEKRRKQSMKIVRFEVLSRSSPMLHIGDPVASSRGETVGVVTSCAKGMNGLCGLALAMKNVEVNQDLSIFPIQRMKDAAPLADLKIGDRIVLPVAAKVLPRFGIKRGG